MTWMELESIMPSEISQPETDKLLYDFTNMWNLKKKTNEQREKKRERGAPRNRLNYREHTRGDVRGRMCEVGDGD